MSDPLVRCEKLTRYLGRDDSRTLVLHSVSFEAMPASSYAIVGPSGCGKSTLLYLLGLLDRPDAGNVWIDGVEASALDDAATTRFRNHHLGFVFQFHFLLPQFTAAENVMLPLMKQGGFSQQEMEERAHTLLDAVGLGNKASRPAGHLSGGEQQRVAVARSLVNRPRVLLADEPTGNLDSANSEGVFSLLLQAVREQGITLLMVTHNEDMARRCDHTLHMADGQLSSIQSAAAHALP